jgi:hypothetical protein
MFKVASEESSDLESHLSLKQTSTYMYVEKIQEFLNVEMDPDNNKKPKVKMLTKEIPIEMTSKQNSPSKDENFMKNQDVDKIYGFRYNQLDNDMNDEWSPY